MTNIIVHYNYVSKGKKKKQTETSKLYIFNIDNTIIF